MSLVRLKVQVNGTEVYSNYDNNQDPAKSEDMRSMIPEDRKLLTEDSTLITARIDDYQMPSLLIKLIKSMKKNSVVEMTTTRVDKLHRNFRSSFLD